MEVGDVEEEGRESGHGLTEGEEREVSLSLMNLKIFARELPWRLTWSTELRKQKAPEELTRPGK